MNEVILEGKVIGTNLDKRGFLRVTVAVLHEHTVNDFTDDGESLITCFVANQNKSRDLYLTIEKDDYVHINGYLRIDHSITNKDNPTAKHNDKKKLSVYINQIYTV